MTQRLTGKSTLITGAASGIGLATAQRFAAEGAMVMLADRQEAALAAARETLLTRQPGARIETFVVDVVDSAGVAALVATVLARFGRIDCLVNNAGITRDTLSMRMTDENWNAVLEADLTGAFRLVRAALRPMMDSKPTSSCRRRRRMAFSCLSSRSFISSMAKGITKP